MVVDFTKKKELLTESWLRQFGAWNKILLKQMYGDNVNMMAPLTSVADIANFLKEEEIDNQLSFVVRGEQKDVKAYANALFSEKKLS